MNLVWWSLGGALAGAVAALAGFLLFYVITILGLYAVMIGAGLGLVLGAWKGLRERAKRGHGPPPTERPFY